MSGVERSTILGAGFAVPDSVYTNDDLSSVLDTNDAWIRKRSGIGERRYVDDSEGSVALAERAVDRALEQAGLERGDIDLLICGTLSQDVEFPGNAFLLAGRLGRSGLPVFDVHNQCSAFLYSLSVADAYVRSGAARTVVIVGSEVHSSGLEYADRSRHVTVLFGDGAGAVVVGPQPDPERGLLQIELHAEGRHAEKLCVLGPGSRQKPRVRAEQLDEDIYIWPQMEGQFVFRHAVSRMTEVIQSVLDAEGVAPSDLALLVPHQANLRINQMVALGLGLDDTQLVNNIERYGNTTAATIPILLSETLADGRVAAVVLP